MSVSSEAQHPDEREAFENGFLHFAHALEVLSLPAAEQCERMGNFNVAWEIKDDVAAAAYLLRSPHVGRLSAAQREATLELLAALKDVPVKQLPGGSDPKHNRAAMNHPSWEPLRERAVKLLALLAPAIEECKRYLHTPGRELGAK